MSGWDTYIHQIQNKFDAATGQWAKTNVVQFACVYGHDGNMWATSPHFQLATYEFDMPQEDGSTTKTLCNEVQSLIKACGGNRKGGQDCGLRICNQKYMFLKSSEEKGVKYCTLSRGGGGGATVAITNKALLVGVWDKESDMSDGKKQNVGACEAQVLNVAVQLLENQY